MPATRRRESVIFQARVRGAGDGAGNSEAAWDVVNQLGPFSARLRPINGREEVLAGKLQGVQPFELNVRFCAATAGVTTAHRVLDARTQQPYRITAIQNPDERNQELSMLLVRGKGEG